MVAICNPARGNWKSMLIAKVGSAFSVVARFEHHESHPGLHVHAHCDRGAIEIGASGLDNLIRIPDAKQRHRRQAALTETTFWQASMKFFRIEDSVGPLFAHAGI